MKKRGEPECRFSIVLMWLQAVKSVHEFSGGKNSIFIEILLSYFGIRFFYKTRY